MVFGIIETGGLEDPPGTVLLLDEGVALSVGHILNIKHGKGKVRFCPRTA